MSASGRPCANIIGESISTMADGRIELENVINCASKFVTDIAQTYEGDDCRPIECVKEAMESFCKLDHEVGQIIKALELVKGKYLDGEDINLLHTFEGALQEIQANTGSKDPKSHRKYKQIMELIQDSRRRSVVTTGPEVIDEDLMVTQAQQSIRCPYTGQEMVNPVKNIHCGHSYDFEGILDFIKNKGNKARCPVSGCINENPLHVDDLVENKDLRRIILQKKSSADGCKR